MLGLEMLTSGTIIIAHDVNEPGDEVMYEVCGAAINTWHDNTKVCLYNINVNVYAYMELEFFNKHKIDVISIPAWHDQFEPKD